MEFDISKVYTAVNADELKVGSKFIGAENLAELKQKVQNGNTSDIYKLKEVFPENLLWRFRGICRPFYLAHLRTFCLAYLVEEPNEKKLEQFDLNEFARKALDIAETRQKNGALIKTDTRSMLKHCATEVVEAVEAYCRTKVPAGFKIGDVNDKTFASELADIICCALIVAAKEGIDIEEALEEVQEKNQKRAEGTGDKL